VAEFQERQQQIRDERHPNLRHQRIRTCADEAFDFCMLLEPFEEQLDLPALLVDRGYRRGWPHQVVGQETQLLAGRRIVVDDAPKRARMLAPLDSRQMDDLVSSDPCVNWNGTFLQDFVQQPAFRPCDEMATGHTEPLVPAEVVVATVEHIHRVGFEVDLGQDLVIVQMSFRDTHEFRQPCGMVQPDVELDRTLLEAVMGPGKEDHAEQDRGGIQRQDLLVDGQGPMTREALTTLKQDVKELFIQLPGLLGIDPAQGCPRCVLIVLVIKGLDTHMITQQLDRGPVSVASNCETAMVPSEDNSSEEKSDRLSDRGWPTWAKDWPLTKFAWWLDWQAGAGRAEGEFHTGLACFLTS